MTDRERYTAGVNGAAASLVVDDVDSDTEVLELLDVLKDEYLYG
jgi:hypothetical protein